MSVRPVSARARSTERPINQGVAFAVAALGLFFGAGAARAQEVVSVADAGVLACSEIITFDEVTGGAPPGSDYNGVLAIKGVTMAERFAGQVLGLDGEFDVLSGVPANPLSLQAGSTGKNLKVIDQSLGNFLAPMGAGDYPLNVGDGSVAFLFGTDQSTVRFDFVGGNGGSATLDFFRSDGSPIQELSVAIPSGATTVGFERAGGLADIAGVSIQHNDPFGLGFDNLCVEDMPVLEVGISAELLSGPSLVYAQADSPSHFVIEISYSGPDALVIDTVPAELEVLGCVVSTGSVALVSRSNKPGRGPTRLEWSAPEGAGQLSCELETRQKAGNDKKGPVYQPTGCGDLVLNEGPNAYEVDPATGELVYVEQEDPNTGLTILAPVLVAGPGESLSVEVAKLKGSCTTTAAAALGTQGLGSPADLLGGD